jgi:hypothetical protein
MQRKAEITAAENTALFYPFDVEYYASGGDYDPDTAHRVEPEGGSSDRDVKPSPEDENFSISVLLSLFALPREVALAAYREAGCCSDEAVKVLIRQECPINKVQSPFLSSASGGPDIGRSMRYNLYRTTPPRPSL